jgi:hypothetical protein
MADATMHAAVLHELGGVPRYELFPAPVAGDDVVGYCHRNRWPRGSDRRARSASVQSCVRRRPVSWRYSMSRTSPPDQGSCWCCMSCSYRAQAA